MSRARDGVAVLLLLLAACQSHVDRMQPFRASYASGDIAGAEAILDKLIAEEADVAELEVGQTAALSDAIDPLAGDMHLLLLEKAMTRLASGDVDNSARLLERARQAFDSYYRTDFQDYWQEAESALVDDAVLTYDGADYEHVVLRTMQALTEFVRGGPDVFPFALQIEEKQRQIAESSTALETEEEGVTYNPRAQYQRVPIGLYLLGVLAEEKLQAQNAREYFQQALDATGESSLLRDAVARAEAGIYSPAGHGSVHVLYLAGRGPTLIESTDVATELARSIANVGVAVLGKTASSLVQAPVPVPAVQVNDPAPAPLSVQAPDGTSAATEPLLDLNVVAQQQLDANKPVILARAVVRRTVKAALAGAVERGMGGDDQPDDLGDLFGFAAGAAANLLLTSGERADTRIWGSLPAQIQATRLTLPEGAHELVLGDGTRLPVRVSAGHATVVLAIRPALDRPALIVVDEASRVDVPVTAPPAPAPDVAATAGVST